MNMEKLRNQIVESFFNPLLHFLPLLFFVIARDFWGNNIAWKVAFGINVILLIYIYFRYRRIVDWFLFSTAIFFVISTIISLISQNTSDSMINYISGEIVVLVFFATSLIFRKKFESLLNKFSPRNFSMVNNLNELFRLMWIFTIIFITYVIVISILYLYKTPNYTVTREFIHTVYLATILFVVVYELIRVTIIRIRLIKEEWWPIVNEQGKLVGSIHHLSSLKEEKKYMHPIIRVIIIDKNRIFLQKRSDNDLVFPGMWDTAISNHIRLNEKVEHCIFRTAYERYGVKELKPIFLSHYIHETEQELHYAYIFVACKNVELKPNPKYIDQTKWWTIQQIEENINSGIFTENFVTELNYLKRSGLIDSGSCECECKLKDMVNKYKLNAKSH